VERPGRPKKKAAWRLLLAWMVAVNLVSMEGVRGEFPRTPFRAGPAWAEADFAGKDKTLSPCFFRQK